MSKEFILSNVTKDYLTQFYRITETMAEQMTNAAVCESISESFINQIIPHHEASIKMSENILKYTTGIPVQSIANRIIAEQSKIIENLSNSRKFCVKASSSQDLSLYRRKAAQIIHKCVSEVESTPQTNTINCNFMRAMIPHLKGAVRLAENALQYEVCPEIKPMLSTIIVSQKRLIIKIDSILRCLNC